MAIKGGYFFRILDADLTAGKMGVESFDEDFARRHVGGRGFGIRLVWDNLCKHEKLDPLGPENILVIAPGPLSGTLMPSSGKNSFVSISPATGLFGDSSMGGGFGVELRQAGYDAVVLRGSAPELSILMIDGDDVSVIPAPELKGKSCLQTEGMVRERLGDQTIRVAAIGVGGENGVVFATVNADWSRNAGRTGIGAILGSKNIKAIAARGGKDLPVHDLDRVTRQAEEGYAALASHPYFQFWQQQGLMSVIDYANEAGFLPTHNFRDGHFDRADSINGYLMEQRYKIGDSACFACPMACGNICLVKEGKYAGTVTEGPEYETAAMLGSNVGVSDFSAVLRANQMCDELGIDTISTGNLIGVVIEAYESGAISLADLDGTPIHWGDAGQVLSLVEKIGRREGIGDTLAGGSRSVMERWPGLSPIISQVKGLEQSAYDCRGAISMALAYGTSDIGAHHTRAWTVAKELEMGKEWPLEKKVDLVIEHQTIRPLFDMLGVCRLPWIELGFDVNFYARQYSAVTGEEVGLDELCKRSGRLYDVTRRINCHLGAGRKDDYPPDRCFDMPVHTGPQAGKKLDRAEYERALDIYYERRGWDREGVPPGNPEA